MVCWREGCLADVDSYSEGFKSSSSKNLNQNKQLALQTSAQLQAMGWELQNMSYRQSQQLADPEKPMPAIVEKTIDEAPARGTFSQ